MYCADNQLLFLGCNDGAELLVKSVKLLSHLLAETVEVKLLVTLYRLGSLVFHIVVKINSLFNNGCELVACFVRVVLEEK